LPRGPRSAPHGARWNYPDGNTILLARMFRDEPGGDPASVLRLAHRELFDSSAWSM